MNDGVYSTHDGVSKEHLNGVQASAIVKTDRVVTEKGISLANHSHVGCLGCNNFYQEHAIPNQTIGIPQGYIL